MNKYFEMARDLVELTMIAVLAWGGWMPVVYC